VSARPCAFHLVEGVDDVTATHNVYAPERARIWPACDDHVAEVRAAQPNWKITDRSCW